LLPNPLLYELPINETNATSFIQEEENSDTEEDKEREDKQFTLRPKLSPAIK
jgi:hypothetical protein